MRFLENQQLMDMKSSILKRYLGPKEFYQKVATIAFPVAIQQLLNSAMGIIDSVMVSQIGQVTAVGNAAQIESIILTVCFGAATGAGIFVAQFFGARDTKNQKRAFGLGLVLCFVIGLVGVIISFFFGKTILSFFLNDSVVVESSWIYLQIVLLSYIPSSLTLMFSYAYRSIQKTFVPMLIGTVAMVLNVVINYTLIFGHFGFPEMGIAGAAIGTVVAQGVSILIHIIYATMTKQPFIGSVKELFHFDKHLFDSVVKKTIPFIINEFFFAIGGMMYIRAFGQLGTKAMDSYYVGNQISNVFFFVVTGIGNACSAVLGASLGKGDLEEARQRGDYFIGMGVIVSIIASIVILLSAEYLVAIFNLQDVSVIRNSVIIVQTFALRIALRMFNVIVFSSLRAGGDSKYLTFLDAGIMWLVGIPLSFLLVNGLGLDNIALVFLIVQLEQVVRIIFGMKRYYSGQWLQNLTR